jgi:large repetitive protein
MVACGDGGQASLATPRLSYNGSMPFPAVVGEAIAVTPAVSGTLAHFRVNPDLPSGLSIDELSGVISGTPTKASASATYVVSATGAGIRVTFPLVLSVTEPPRDLSYTSPVGATVGVALAPQKPRISGSVDHYVVSPTLPPGIVINSTSGILSGTPSEAKKLAPYTITASSLAGHTRFILLLTVTPAPPGAMPRHGPTRRGLDRDRIQPIPSRNLPAVRTEPSRNIHASGGLASDKYPGAKS